LSAAAGDLRLLRLSIAIGLDRHGRGLGGALSGRARASPCSRAWAFPACAALVALYGAAALGPGHWASRCSPLRRRWIWTLQLGVILGYTAIITGCLPEQWLHPYGRC
jgi:hypothetical protein